MAVRAYVLIETAVGKTREVKQALMNADMANAKVLAVDAGQDRGYLLGTAAVGEYSCGFAGGGFYVAIRNHAQPRPKRSPGAPDTGRGGSLLSVWIATAYTESRGRRCFASSWAMCENTSERKRGAGGGSGYNVAARP